MMNAANLPAYAGRTKYTLARAASYQNVSPAKHRAEMRLVDRAFVHIPCSHRILDIPCGGGRVAVHLAHQGYEVHCADLSRPMLAIAQASLARAGIPGRPELQDVEAMSYGHQSFDAVLCFRLFHHFPGPELRGKVVREVCRVARHFVVLSYFSPFSITSIHRRWRHTRTGKPMVKFPTKLSEVGEYFAAAGFELVRDYARMPVIHTLHLAVFRRLKESP